MKFPRIVVKAPNWIGDTVLAGPFLSGLRAHWPRAHVAVLTREKVRPAVERVAAADEIVDETDRGAGRRIYGGEFDVLISLSSSWTVPLAGALARVPLRVGFSGGGRGVFFTHPVAPLPRSLHQVEHYLGLGAALGAFRPALPRLAWRMRAGDVAEAGAFLKGAGETGRRPLVAFAPGGTYGPAKRWFVDRWARLGDLLSLKMDCGIVIVGGEGERGDAATIAEQMARAPANAAGRLSLAGTAALLARCRAFASNDSGLLHVGAAVGVPTLGLFGSSNPHWTGPYGKNCLALWGHVPCSPCYRRGCLPGRNYACLDALSVEMAWGEMGKLISGRGNAQRS